MNYGRRYSDISIQGPLPKKPPRNRTANENMIRNYIAEKNVTPWFRGTSYLHIKGSDALFNAIRDDTEQSTTHRVRECLNLIGLEPMISSKDIEFLMRLSRGSDLCFLWFLMEKHYKTPKTHNPNYYSLNEQLICSAICNLDTIPTLRELDKILPVGHTSRIEMKKSGERRKQLKDFYQTQANVRKTAKYVLPYFEKYPKPLFYGKKLTLELPNFKVSMDRYKLCEDPNYRQRNEKNRWFANYRFSPNHRVIHAIIKEIIASVVEDHEALSENLTGKAIMCEYHKILNLQKLNKKREEMVRDRDQCLKGFLKEDKTERIKRIKELIEHDVAVEMRKLKEKCKDIKRKNYADALRTITSKGSLMEVVLGEKNSEKSYCICSNNDLNILNEDKKIYRTKDPKNPNESIKCKLETSFSQCIDDLGLLDYDVSTSSELVFHRPLLHQPYKFDYHKIFPSPTKQKIPDEKKSIQKLVLKALDIKTPSDLSHITQDQFNEAIEECAQDIFDHEVSEYEEKNKKLLAAQDEERNRPLCKYPRNASYDAQDTKLMDQMLYDAMQVLRKNPRFVLAQLPDAHRLPLLREWIYRRFGKEYSPKEKQESFRRSCKVFRALRNYDDRLKFPNVSQLGRNMFLNYNCRDYVDKKVKHLRNQYYRRLDLSILEKTKIFWFSMRGYICSNGPPRKTFYAYMPSRLRDIHHFRLWKSTEYRNCKVSRQERKQKMNSFES